MYVCICYVVACVHSYVQSQSSYDMLAIVDDDDMTLWPIVTV